MRIIGEKIPTRADPARGDHAEPVPGPSGPPGLSNCRRQRPPPGQVVISDPIQCVGLRRKKRLSVLLCLAGTGSVKSVSGASAKRTRKTGRTWLHR